MEKTKKTISQESAINAIVQAAIPYMKENPSKPEQYILMGISDALNAIKALPSAQPEIIRCKDCGKRKVCRTSTAWPGDDWYCADAERRTDDEQRCN